MLNFIISFDVEASYGLLSLALYTIPYETREFRFKDKLYTTLVYFFKGLC